MKPLLKKDKASGSVSEESSSQRPKRTAYLKTLDGSNGLLWREENDLKRALYASLQETRKRNLDDEEEGEEDLEEAKGHSVEGKKVPAAVSENGQDEILKKAKVHAQRKFAQGTNPNSPVPTPVKVPYVNNSTKELLPYKRPKTEDFLTFLCLRGTSILPPSLDFLNCCSKSDTSSDCRSLSPDPEAKDFASHKESVSKGSEPRERNSARHENLSNGVSRKSTTCKASSKKHAISSQTAKKTGSKSQKETNIVRKRKSRDDSEDAEFMPANSSSRFKSSVNARTRGTTFHALREKYKKQRLAADKKKVPTQPTSSSGNTETKGLKTRSQSAPKKNGKTSRIGPSKRQSQSVSPVLNKKKTGFEHKLAVEKRKSLRSAHPPPKGLAHRKGLNKKTMWLRRAKLVPPIVDVESDSDPEVVNPSTIKKKSPKQQEKMPRLSGRLREKSDNPKEKTGLTSRQILLRKHMQSRLAAKKSALHAKNIKSKTIVKKTAKQVLSKKVFKKNLASKTMSLRKDHQNKRVTRSAKQQIEEMLWSHPEKKSKFGSKGVPASRIDKKRISSDDQLPSRKQKVASQKVGNNKQGRTHIDKEVKTRTPSIEDGNKVYKPTTSKLDKKGDALVNTRSSKTIQNAEPKPGCSFTPDHLVLQPKPENVNISDNKTNKTSESKLNKSVENKINKPAMDTVKKENQISDPSKQVPKSSKPFDVWYQEKKSKLAEELKSKKIVSRADVVSNIKSNMKPHNDKESNVLIKDKTISSKHSSLVTNETSVQNNLNLQKNDKNLNKDISKLINLNVECEEPAFALNCEPSCSGIGQKDRDKKLNIRKNAELDSKSELLHNANFIKKHYDPKYIKNMSFKEEKLKKISDKNCKIQNKTSKKISKPHKKETEGTKNKTKKDINKHRRESILLSDSDSDTEIIENDTHIKGNSRNKTKKESSTKEKLESKKNRSEKSDGKKRFNKLEQKRKSNIDPKKRNDSKTDSSSVNNSNSIFDQETDDDSDNDITLGDYLKLKSKVSSDEHFPTKALSISQTKESNATIKSEKELQKSKKEGESSKHKKEKNNSKDKSSEKSFKKEDKMSRRDSDKSLAKLLKRERSKSSRKEEKLKHKRDGSSSSKSSRDKDGSKLSKKEGDKESSSEKKNESKSELSDIKNKSSKKESKLSRSNSYDDTKSPKKKKKLNNEFQQIEEIKNLINNSTILNEISGFKDFKRRLSGDKSEFKRRLSKSKKRKKLALLKEKKLSKKLSSKLLRKYSKKKGLKKKNKLKKKELKKESKLGTPSTKVHSKNKNKHKTKNEHKKDNQEKNKTLDKVPSCSISTETVSPTSVLPHAVSKLGLPTQTQNIVTIIPQPVSSEAQTCTGDIVISSVLPTETITPSILDISRKETLDNTLGANDSSQDVAYNSRICGTTYPTEALVQSTRNSISQIPLHFAQEIPSPSKTMTDAATNTCDDDLDETLSPIPELLRNIEMSVGTQTITPVGSPSPTTEMRSIVPTFPIESPLIVNSTVNCLNSNIAMKSSSKLPQSVTPTTSMVPDKLITKCANNHLASARVIPKVFSGAKQLVIPVTQTLSVPRIIPRTINSTSGANINKGFSVSSGKHGRVNILPVSIEKSKQIPYKISSSLIIPVVTPTITKSMAVKNDIRPKGVIGSNNHCPAATAGKSSMVQSSIKNLGIPISPGKKALPADSISVKSPVKNTLLANPISVKSHENPKVLTSFVANPTSTFIAEKSKVTNCNTVSTNVTAKSTIPVSASNLSSPVPTVKSRDNTRIITPVATLTSGKAVVVYKISSPPTVTSNSVNSTTITPVKTNETTSSIAAPITPEKPKAPSSSCNTSQTNITPVKSKTVTPSAIPGQSPSPKVKKRNIKKSKSPSVSPTKPEPFPFDTARLVSAPVYYPQAHEFNDPLEYINKIRPEAEQYGICKIVPPASFKPECKVNDDMRFTAHNQYLHKMLHRWGPNVQHTACIRKHLKTQKVKLEQAPLIGGIELDVSKFYHTVQQFGGLQQVIEKKKWQKVADVMRVPKTAQDRVTKLYDAYCKYLVSYDTLPSEEKKKIEEEVLADHDKWTKLRNSPSESEKEDEDMEDENNDCVSKGRSMSLSNFFRIARNTMSMWYKNDPPPEEVENEFWKLVTERQQHIVVHAGNIDSSVTQSGFPINKSPFAKHPWNLKILTNNSRSILKSMGPLSGITIPTLHVGMLFTTGCWYRDPHSFPWIEYLHTGASKIWYGIPANGCQKFRNAMKKIMPEYCTTKPLWLSSDTAMVPPDLLVKHGASLSRTIQSSGQFIVIFPESFTSTICCGYCVSESVYFAPTSWLDLAVKAFQDIQNSCESPAFSLERLLFSIGNDPKPQLKVHLKILQKILPMIENIRQKELHIRTQLHELGLKQFERLPLFEVREKKKKARSTEEEDEQECEVCRTPCYVSMVIYPQEDSVYCLPHALEHIEKKNLKLCKLKYTYSEHDLNELIKKITDLVSQLPSPSATQKPSKKKLPSLNEK